MENIFEKDINIDEYKPESRGVQAYKRLSLLIGIFIIYTVSFEFLTYFWLIKKNIFNIYLQPRAYLFVGIGVFCICLSVLNLVLYLGITRVLENCTIEEKLDYNFCVYKKSKRKKNNNVLTAIACNYARMGNKEGCAQALSLLSKEYHPKILTDLKKWIESDEATFDISLLKLRKRGAGATASSFMLLIIAVGVFSSCLSSSDIIYSGLSDSIISIIGIIQAGAWLYITMYIIGFLIYILGRNSIFTGAHFLRNYRAGIMLIAILILLFYCSINPIVQYTFESKPEENDSSTEYSSDIYNEDSYDYDYGNDYDYDYEESYDDSYPAEIDIMNEMIVLCNYLQKNGVIDDFKVELGYSAKGDVKGTVAEDSDYVYVLYDNGTKEDENGNECIELVLEAEPLDDSGNSLGQQEAKLMGFYLVNLSTDEVIDEHKTTW